MSITAAHCSKTLVIASTHGNPALRQCAKLLLPGMIECVAKIAVLEESETLEMHSQIVGEVLKAFAALFASTSEDNSEREPLKLALIILTSTHRTATSERFTPGHDDAIEPIADATILSSCTNHRANTQVCGSVSWCLQRSHRQTRCGHKGSPRELSQTGVGRRQTHHR